MYAMNRHAVKMQFVFQKIKIQFVNAHQATEVIQYQKLVVNYPMLVRNAMNHQFVRLQQPVIFVNAHQAILDSQNRLDAIRLVNAKVMHNARIVLDVLAVVVLINAMIYAVQICCAQSKTVKQFVYAQANLDLFPVMLKTDVFVMFLPAHQIMIVIMEFVVMDNVRWLAVIKMIVVMVNTV